MTVRKMVLIGGGEIGELETYKIDKRILELADKKRPRALFIPTASGDAEGYYDSFKKVYGDKLKCDTDVLYLLDSQLKEEEIKGKIDKADIIYVGGGNTSEMLRIWKEKKVNQFLEDAYKRGTVMSGLSAGSICWFKYGQSEIENDASEDGYDYIKIEAMGILNAFHCPHYNEGRRKEVFIAMMKESKEIGIALDNNCAIEIVGDQYKIIKSVPEAQAYKLYVEGEEVISKGLKATDGYRPFKEIIE